MAVVLLVVSAVLFLVSIFETVNVNIPLFFMAAGLAAMAWGSTGFDFLRRR